jgi:hypothetical protein
MLALKTVERCVKGEKIVDRNLQRDGGGKVLSEVDAVEIAAVLETRLAAGGVHEQFAHRPGGCAEEMSTAVPSGVLVADELEVDIMDKGGGLKSLPGGDGRQACPGQLPQLVVDEGKEVRGSVRLVP